jgi:hypothetical protein
MRAFAIPLLLFVAGSAKVCSSEDKAGGGVSATASASGAGSAAADAKATLVAPRIGGSVAGAGEFSVELAVHQDGLVEGLVSDAQGKLVSDGVKLTAAVQAKGGATEKLELGFALARARFEGHAKAGVELVPGPVDVTLDVAGKTSGCRLSIAAVLPEPRLGGHVLAAGAFTAELFAGISGEVRAFIKDSAGAEVKADAGASFKAIVNAEGGAREAIALSFDAPRACFAGHAKAGVVLAPGPLELVVDAKVGAGIGRLESIGLSVEASHGGQIVAVGDYSLELVAKGHEISAFAFDASGKAHAAGDLDLKLEVGQGAGTTLVLKWDAPSLSYVGSAAANVNLALQPIRVSLVASGKAFVGAVASLSAAAKANVNLKANVDLNTDAKLAAAAKLSAKAQAKLDAAAKASAAKAASASVKITPPKVNLGTSQSASATAKAGGGAKAGAGVKASAGLSLGIK